MSSPAIPPGVCPIGKFTFSHEDALNYKCRIVAVLQKMSLKIVSLDGVLPDANIRSEKHVAPAVAHFHHAGIDAIFMSH